jgi:hypothetical protein
MTRNVLLSAGLLLALWAPVAEAAPKKVDLYRTWTVKGSDTLGAYEGTLRITNGGIRKVQLAADLVYDGGTQRSWSAEAWYVFGRIYAKYNLTTSAGMSGALSGGSASQVKVRVKLYPNSSGSRMSGRYDGTGFSGRERVSLPGAGYRWSSRVLASVLASNPGLDKDSLLIEAVRQSRAAARNRYLSRVELQAAAQSLTQGNLAPAITFSTTHPGATLTRSGDDWVLTSDRSGASSVLGARAEATLAFDGHSLKLQASSTGYFATYKLDRAVPEGYWATRVSRDLSNGTLRETFQLRKDAPNTISSQDAARVARIAIARYVRDERMDDVDWKDYYADNWPDLVAAGIETGIAAFGTDFTSAAAAELKRSKDSYTIVDSGPFQLYTEVTISKSTGLATRVYIEID